MVPFLEYKGYNNEGKTDKMWRKKCRGSFSTQTDSVIKAVGKHMFENFILVYYFIMPLQVFYLNKIFIFGLF